MMYNNTKQVLFTAAKARFYNIDQTRHAKRPLTHEACYRYVGEASQQRVVDKPGVQPARSASAAKVEDARAQCDRDVHAWVVDGLARAAKLWLRGHRVRDVVLGRAEVADVKRP